MCFDDLFIHPYWHICNFPIQGGPKNETICDFWDKFFNKKLQNKTICEQWIAHIAKNASLTLNSPQKIGFLKNFKIFFGRSGDFRIREEFSGSGNVRNRFLT